MTVTSDVLNSILETLTLLSNSISVALLTTTSLNVEFVTVTFANEGVTIMLNAAVERTANTDNFLKLNLPITIHSLIYVRRGR